MEEIKIYSFALWIFTATILIIFFVIALMVYFTNREKLFKYYSLYCFFTLLYVLFKFDFGPNIYYEIVKSANHSYEFVVQLIYHAFYLLFGLLFLQLAKFKPKLNRFIERYAYILLLVALLLFFTGFLKSIPKTFYRDFFSFVFLPVHLGFAFFIIGLVIKVKSHSKYYFIIGSLLYIIFGMYAYIVSYNRHLYSGTNLEPIDFFYIAIVLECFVFSYGLAIFVRKLYEEKQLVQSELAEAQQQVQIRLEERIELQEKEKQLLIKENHKQELITEVLNLQQKVIRSQINSHFIFNVLNSIKLFIMENDVEKAYFFLNRFAKFIRHVLDNSLNEYISLKDELENMDLYLSIEKMRFSDKFTYEINIHPDVKLSDFRFPALLLQPFVENALWHGLMTVEKDAVLKIDVEDNGENVAIIIDDNGIGYNASLAKKTNNSHKSLGLTLINERIDHFNRRSANSHIAYEIIDKEEKKIGKGTRVVVNIQKKSGDRISGIQSHDEYIFSLLKKNIES
ncbi:MAG: histidine kinase [Porphyromonadaceae bacterium]|nr:histidine kinase [Porphyromonadaceae bacterium]